MAARKRGGIGDLGLSQALLPGTYAFVAISVVKPPSIFRSKSKEVGRRSVDRLIKHVIDQATAILSVTNAPQRRLLLGFRSASHAIECLAAYYSDGGSTDSQDFLSMGICIGEFDGHGLAKDCMAARKAQAIVALAPDGQVIFSASTFEILRDSPSPNYTFADLGTVLFEFQLRRERLTQLFHPGLPTMRFSISSEERERIPLPHRFGLLIGRGLQIDDAYGRMLRHSIVTIVGPSGIGKSHLASRIAFECQLDGEEDVIWVDLNGITRSDQLNIAIAKALGLRSVGTQRLDQLLLRQLGNRKAVLVLDDADNCRSAVTSFVRQAASITGPRFLITAGQRLKLDDESVVQLGPLDLPARLTRWSPEDLEENDATALFMDRAREVLPEFHVTEEEATAVARICCRLEGHPLSLVLAARRVRELRPIELLFELESIELSPRDPVKPEQRRHESLAGAFQWSFDALTKEARHLIKALSPLRDTCTKEEAERLADVDFADLREPINELLDAGFLTLDGFRDGQDRYRVPNQVARLIDRYVLDDAEREVIREQYSVVMIGKFVQAASKLRGPDEATSMDQLDEFRTDLTEALEYTLRPSASSIKTFADGIGLSWTYWYERNRIDDGLKLLDRALKRFAGSTLYEYGRVKLIAGVLATKIGQTDRAIRYFDETMEFAERNGYPQLADRVFCNMGTAKWSTGDALEAVECFKKVDIDRASETDERNRYSILLSWATACIDVGQLDQAEAFLNRARKSMGQNPDLLALWTETVGRGQLYLRRGTWDTALERFRECVDLAQKMGDLASTARSLAWIAEVAIAVQNFRCAAQLLGATRGIVQESGIQLYPINRLRLAKMEHLCQDALGSDEYRECRILGALSNLTDLVGALVIT